MRSMLATSLVLALASAAAAADPAPLPRVLVFSKTAGFRHESIPTGVKAVREVGQGLFEVDATEDSAAFTPDNLRKYRAVVFLSTTGDVLGPEQERAFEAFIRAGGGFAGIHAAADTEYDWPWFGQLVGAYFKGHPPVQQATIQVEDRSHRSTRFLPEQWVRTDEWYAFRSNPRQRTRVLASLDESTYKPGDAAMGDHPIAWYHEFDGGRSWYTALGHTHESFAEPLFRAHLREGIAWAANLPDAGPAAAPPKQGEGAAPAAPAAPPAKPAPKNNTAPAAPNGAAPAPHASSMTDPSEHLHAGLGAPITLGAVPTAISLGGAMVILACVLGAMGQGVRAPLLALLWPGLGHLSLGYKRRAVLAMVGVLGMFITGLAVGGVDSVDSKEDAAWFIAQAGNGPIAFGADMVNQQLLKTGRVGELVQAPRQGLGGTQLEMVSTYKGIGAANEFGTLLIALGGLMNLILVMDASRRDVAVSSGE